MSDVVRNNERENRYELMLDDNEVAFAAYDRRNGAVAFTHTEVPPDREGEGIGSRLIKGALHDIRAKHLKVVPLCTFVASYIDHHPEEQDLLDQ